MTWGDFFATVLAGGAAATAAFATYRANQEVATLRAEDEARLRARLATGAAASGGMAPPDARAWTHSEGAPLDFLRHIEEHEQRMQRMMEGEHHHHHHHHRFAEGHDDDDGGWGPESDLPEFMYPHHSQRAHGDGSSGYDGYPRPSQRNGMDSFEELLALMHHHEVDRYMSAEDVSMQALGPQQAPPRRVDPHELLEDMRTGGHPEGWEPELWGHLENVHEMMMRRLGSTGTGPGIFIRSSGGHRSETLDPLAMQLSLMDRDFTDADYEMLSRLDDPARNPSNRRPLTDTQLSELPTHTYRPSKGASSPAQQEAFSSSHDPPSLSASSSTQGNLANKSSIWSKTKAVLTPRTSGKAATGSGSSNSSARDAAGAAAAEEAACHGCSICLDDFQPGDGLMTLPCAHQFHASCVGHWLKQEGQAGACPVCKHPVWTQS